ncbi:MAG: hypothetical protein COX62_03240 [Deltaproteobacteria bacterium CG_4_10_14_0_2_um_filter_43_8]|nr:MAG: hypothetical protein COV43_01115 [Deltaproteobacteria bacterium CG11_big_fil_rev_8_21_14_0_20_42_23]PJA21128.1 MAG: hypothetical protein COX62_03240 [Deltaproteobacteria bacterium CG_4_10_14_0_2_um_filter_43_8]PJC63549.1 MAG: hypothetical protein CO021_08875 [Deltaproteobacteria bacterium CG_4_9_14_0_2_um_filter_42_21]
MGGGNEKIMPKKLFYQILFFFLVLGVFPVLLVALILSLPYHFDISWYKRVVGLLLIFSTVSTLCLAALVTRLLKGPLDDILEAQSKIKEGNLKFRWL